MISILVQHLCFSAEVHYNTATIFDEMQKPSSLNNNFEELVFFSTTQCLQNLKLI